MTALAEPRTEPYNARKNDDGTYTIYDVEVFGTVPEGAHGDNPEIDLPFLHACMRRFAQRADEGYSPPLHIQHHGFGEQVERAGEFRLKRIGRAKYEGASIPVLIADLTRVPESVFRRIEDGELPYRSVEVSYSDPEIQSIALLSHDAPFFKFRNLAVQLEVGGMAGFAAQTPALGLFAFRTFQETAMDKPEKPDDEMMDEPAAPEADAPAAADGIEDIVSRVVETVMGQVEAMIVERIAAALAKDEPEADPEPEAEMADEPEAEMADDEDDKDEFSAIQGELLALKAEKRERERADEIERLAAEALADLDEFRLDDETRAEIRTFAAKGADVLSGVVASFKRHLPRDPIATLDELGNADPVDDPIVSRYAAQGAESLAAARAASNAYEAQKRFLRTSREDYIDMQVQTALKGQE